MQEAPPISDPESDAAKAAEAQGGGAGGAGADARRAPGPGDGEGRPETSLQRLDRNLEELTGELRVVVTGVQVLFAFLLIVPFNSGFVGVGPFVRGIYFATLLCSALAALCTLAPAAYHRLLFRADDKRHVVFLANRLSIAGLVFLALAMCGSLLLVTTKLFGATPGVVTAALVALAFGGLWFVAPLMRRAARESAQEAPRELAGEAAGEPAGEAAGGAARTDPVSGDAGQ